MPYVTCSDCHVTSYVALSYLEFNEPCPACDTPLSERATAVAPALTLTAPDRRGSGREQRTGSGREQRTAAHRAAR
jgi:hypothetical protein